MDHCFECSPWQNKRGFALIALQRFPGNTIPCPTLSRAEHRSVFSKILSVAEGTGTPIIYPRDFVVYTLVYGWNYLSTILVDGTGNQTARNEQF